MPTRQEFAKIWVDGFGERFVSHRACCLEKHQDEEKVHYHLCIKLTTLKRWKRVKEQVIAECDTACNFQEFHTNYYDAFVYVTKEDSDYVTSEGHPDLTNQPRTALASQQKRLSTNRQDNSHRGQSGSRPAKRAKLDILNVYDIIVGKNLRSEQDIFVLANE